MDKKYIFAGFVLVLIVAGIFFMSNSGRQSTTSSITSFTTAQPCSDSDSADAFARGVTFAIIEGRSRAHIDYCPTTDSVMEGLCTSGAVETKQVACAKGCVDGACRR